MVMVIAKTPPYELRYPPIANVMSFEKIYQLRRFLDVIDNDTFFDEKSQTNYLKCKC